MPMGIMLDPVLASSVVKFAEVLIRAAKFL